jgi:drug/metabolite transporter (DMT)-like permease
MSETRSYRRRPPAKPRSADWLLFTLLVAIGSASFALIRTAVETIPPGIVSAGRLWAGAAVMYAIMRFGGRRFPRLLVRTPRGYALHRSWAYILAVSAIGYALPFLLYPWAQQYVESGLAGVYMAFMPIWTLALAYAFAGEGLNSRKIAGFALGLIGAIVLLGPDVIGGAARSSILAQGALLLATLCYAASAVIARRARAIRPRVFAAGSILVGAALSTPLFFVSAFDPAGWSLASMASIIGLGIGPTALAGFLILSLIKRNGAGFASLANYLTPVGAVILGALLFHERLEPRVFIALAVILSGVALSQQRGPIRPPVPAAPQQSVRD